MAYLGPMWPLRGPGTGQIRPRWRISAGCGLWGAPKRETNPPGAAPSSEGEPLDELSTRLRYRLEGSMEGWTQDLAAELGAEDVEP
jgi:hypothetical protein